MADKEVNLTDGQRWTAQQFIDHYRSTEISGTRRRLRTDRNRFFRVKTTRENGLTGYVSESIEADIPSDRTPQCAGAPSNGQQ